MYTCSSKSDNSEMPASATGNVTRSYNELATLMYVTGLSSSHTGTDCVWVPFARHSSMQNAVVINSMNQLLIAACTAAIVTAVCLHGHSVHRGAQGITCTCSHRFPCKEICFPQHSCGITTESASVLHPSQLIAVKIAHFISHVAGEDAIKHLLSRGTHREFGYGALVTMLVVYFLGAVWAAGSAVASGLFVPMLLIGSCVGRIVGLICVDVAAAGGHGSPRYCSLASHMHLSFQLMQLASHMTRVCLGPEEESGR